VKWLEYLRLCSAYNMGIINKGKEQARNQV
jgi:hypothetical protein